MPVNLICQMVAEYSTGLPTDVFTNTWSFRDFSLNNDFRAAADVLNPFVQDFYDSVYGSTTASYMGPIAGWNNRWYDRDSPTPRVPYILPARTIGTTADDTVVSPETSIVLSFQGVQLSGSPQARRRGRIFLGGLPDQAVAPSSSLVFPRPSAAWNTNISNAAAALLAAVDGAGDYMWTVWSTASNSYVQVTNGWIDNALDTQRRRGVAPSVRTTWP